MADKLIINILGFSARAEGVYGICAVVIIVLAIVLANVLAKRRA
jgi:hypothetical protein